MISYAKVLPSVIQNENHIYYQNNVLQDYVKKYGIVLESWYPLGGRGNTLESLNNTVIADLSKKYDKTPAQIILRWQIEAGYIPVPGSKNPKHIKENIDIFDFELTKEDMKKILDLNKMKRYENW